MCSLGGRCLFFEMQRLFGRRSAPSDTQMLKEITESRDLLDRRVEHLQRKIEGEVHAAVEHKKHDRKSHALGCLKRKQMLEGELSTLHAQQLKLDSQEHAIQSLRFNELTLRVESRATEVIKTRVAAIGGVDRVEAQRDKTEELLEDAYELLSAAAQPISHPALNNATDEELLAELDELEAAEELQKLTHVGEASSSKEPACGPSGLSAASLPVAPQVRCKQNEDRALLAELEKLTASMAVEKEPMPMLGKAAAPDAPAIAIC